MNNECSSAEKWVPPHGDCRELKSFQVSQLVCDVTVRLCNRMVELEGQMLAALKQLAAAQSGKMTFQLSALLF